MGPTVLLMVALAAAGATVMTWGLAAGRRANPDLGELEDLVLGRREAPPQIDLREPFLRRVVARPLAHQVDRLLPGTHRRKVAELLAQAGLSHRRTVGQHVAIQLGLTAAGAAVAALAFVASPGGLAAAALLLPVMGFMLPTARLKRAARARADAVFRDLPDMIDMLTIAVEAGSGFEAAMSLVCQRFDSPMADELSFALNEMALGMPRREALQGLRDRVDLDVVRTFALSLIQADALGIPLSRVLKTQAVEIRSRRRAWAREKAAKMPVKILFPLVLFVFPPILAIVLGPAGLSLAKT